MARVAARVAAEKVWDQSAYNQEIFTLAHGPYTSPNVSVRVAESYVWMNSRVGMPPPPRAAAAHLHQHQQRSAAAAGAVQGGQAHAQGAAAQACAGPHQRAPAALPCTS